MELRFRVASEPRDMAARIALAALENKAGRPGAALRHYAVVERNGELTPAAARALSGLYATRLVERLEAGDGGAYRDAEAALALARAFRIREVVLTRATQAEAYALAALSALRRGSLWARRDADKLLLRAAELAPGDPRLAARTRAAAGNDARAHAGLWLYRGGAMSAAHELLRSYIEAGGLAPQAVRAWVMAEAWWGLSLEALDRPRIREILAQGISLCPLANAPNQYGCAGTWWDVALGDHATAAWVHARAEALGWRSADPDAAAAWAMLALRMHAAGQGTWSDVVRQRVDLDAVLKDPAQVPGFALPTLLRVAGRRAEAEAALQRVLGAGVPATHEAALLLAAEASLTSQSPALVRRLVESPLPANVPAKHPDVVHAIQRLLRQDAPGSGSADAAGDHAALVPKPAELRSLAALAAAYLREPAVADRLADTYIDGAVYSGRRGSQVAALFASLGDTGRAYARWQRVVTDSPDVWRFRMELSNAAAAMGDRDQADVHLTRAAAMSGDAGGVYLDAARLRLRRGDAMGALEAARQAVGLSAKVRHVAALKVAYAAALALGRDRDAAGIRAELARLSAHAAAPAREQEPAAQDQDTARAQPPASAADLSSPAQVLAWARARVAQGDREAAALAIGRAMGWNPDAIELYEALYAYGSDAEQKRALAALLEAAVIAPGAAAPWPWAFSGNALGPARWEAMAAIQRALKQHGRSELARRLAGLAAGDET